MKFKIFKYKTVTSTNDVAIDFIKEKKEEAGCILAENQTKGRGTQGKKWISEIGNLFTTFFFPLNKNYPPFNEFTIINPIIISSVLKNFCGQKVIKFKSPNDVFLNGKKISGILQEIITLNNKKFLLVGIGMNIVSNPDIDGDYKATNILLESNKKPSIDKIIDLLVLSYEKFFFNLDSYNYKKFKQKIELMALK